MSDKVETTPRDRPGRDLSWPWFLVVVIVYAGVIQGLGQLVGVDTSGSDSQFPTAESILRNALIPIGASIVFAAGVGEELMFRGIGVHVFSRAGFSEGKIALYSSVVFGLVHISNAFGEGAQALVQALVVSTSGYFFYLCLRVRGTLLLPMLVHGLWDTSLISNLVGDSPQASLGMVLVIVLQVVLIVVLAVRRRSVEPASGNLVPPAETPATGA
ncbi:CPBP family intramembrane metalloprotease [Streptomyces sp. NBC_01558]|uniref:CPBP family intramembrane glutamic endopeptidase n=1 Tax=Streptomyces sp. NBC_01558 TaxID=2975878 RepID=UPI002DD92458|nr:CPBP family intramembrane glutamic endopeptidase [Streptomyces sp. NBC_01558]WSD81544.1 CPBP family intramembrane metalloprotease [Streptomyces sp. NBC_01558]